MKGYSLKTQEAVAICRENVEKYLGSKENFCFVTGVAFLSLATLLFLRILVT